MNISILICTWNNARRLAVTLDEIANCKVPDDIKWELVLVNNNCTDETDIVVQQFLGKLPIKYIKESQQGLSRARNAGLQVASGRLVIFTDDDVKPCREWITEYWSAFQERPEGFFFGGPIESEFEGINPEHELLEIAPASVRGWSCGNEPRELPPNDFFLSANWACPRDILASIGSFNVNKGLNGSSTKIRIGEETDMMKRLLKLGMKSRYIPKALVIHIVPEHKCDIKHIAARYEARGFELISEFYRQKIQSMNMRKVPYGMYKKALRAYLRWIFARVTGHKAYREYITWRYKKGSIIGVSEAIRQRKEMGHSVISENRTDQLGSC